MINIDPDEAKPLLPAPLATAADRIPDPLQMHPELAATILYDPTEPASEDDWPVEFR